MKKPIPVLLIEDNPTDVYVIKQVLKQSGLEQGLQVATDGAQAMDLWQSIQAQHETQNGTQNDAHQMCPTLVLLDLNIPKVSGREILARIRSSPHCGSVPVVVVTSSDSPEDLAAIRALNASAYFRKPIDLSDFMELGKIIAQTLADRKVT
jgi:CheY-like chemotaxis protein